MKILKTNKLQVEILTLTIPRTGESMVTTGHGKGEEKKI
jgi:hypothetical protein